MPNSTEVSTPVISEAHPAEFYVWEVPEKEISIHLSLGVIDGLNRALESASRSGPMRGSEIGGVLLGRTKSDGKLKVIVEQFEPVPCEYASGPSYYLSEQDKLVLEATLAKWAPASGKLIGVVGFYRSHTRKDLFLSDHDLALISDYLPDPANVFLLVKPFTTRASIAGFFFREGDHIRHTSSYLEFPFERSALGVGDPKPRASNPERQNVAPVSEVSQSDERSSCGTVLATEDPLQPVTEEEDVGLVPAIVPPPRVRSGKFWFALAAIPALFLAFFALRIVRPSRPPAAALRADGSLALAVSQSQNQLHVTWNRNSAAISSARKANLEITDGDYRKNLELDGKQVQKGSVVYSRITDDVNLRLKVFTERGHMVSETVRIVAAPVSAAIPEPVRTLRKAKTVSNLVEGSPREQARRRVAKAPARERATAFVVPTVPPHTASRPEQPDRVESEISRPASRR